MTKVIDFFDGTEYDFLSNFHPCEIEWQGRKWRTSEHAYQAAKTLDPKWFAAIHKASDPGEAKWLGQRCPMRPDWGTVKFPIMIELLRIKFRVPAMRKLLLATGDAELIEGNTWHDTIWGVYKGVGENNLGRTLMLVRAEARCEELQKRLDRAKGYFKRKVGDAA